jgi:hypothetical protein
MSTPTGKPFTPVRISDYAPKRVRDRMGTTGGPAERDARSEPEDAPVAAQPDDGFEEPAHQATLAPVGPHERHARPHDRGEDDRDEADDAPEYRAANDDGEDDAYSDAAAAAAESEHPEPKSGRVQAERVQRARARAHADRAQADDALASRRDEYEEHRDAYAVDLEQLEDDLTSFRSYSGESSRRLPPAGQLPPVRGLRSPDETYIDGFRLPRSLDPSFLPPPPLQERTDHWLVLRRALIAVAIAAPIAGFVVYYFAAVNEAPTSRAPKLASVSTELASLPPMPPMSQETSPAPQVAPPPPPQVVAPPPPQAAAPVAPRALQAPQPPMPQPAAAAPAAPQTASPPPATWPERRETIGVAMAPPNAVTLNSVAPRPVVTHPVNPAPRDTRPDEIAMLMRQAEQFISAGDVVTARVLFERAAEAGDAKAALSMGATFDPALLAKIGVRGILPDIAKARSWYEKARELGSAEARGRLETLATR